MASSPFSFFVFLSSLLLYQPLHSTANLHKINLLGIELLSNSSPLYDTPPTRYYEVTKPIKLPKTKPCSHLILHHDFGYTYGKPPVIAHYTPPLHCPSQNFSKIVLEWQSTCEGRQFDRIFGLWLGGVELLRGCSAEPRATGIIWSVEKDISRYSSLLMTNQTLAVYLGNVVDSTYTGIYHVNITIRFYPDEEKLNFNHYKSNFGISASGYHPSADLILPISRKLPLNDGLWFEIQNSTDTALEEFKVPQNAYRVVLEVYVSFHENDESWYSNLPNDYIAANNLTDTPGNGPFREVVVSLDDEIVGSIWPFTVIYTGGVNPLLWRPITGIGSFNLPSYDIEITPFLGKILDGNTHKIGFSVTNALNVWYIDANLHLWLDKRSVKTEGKLFKHCSLPVVPDLVYDFEGLSGTFWTNVTRSVSSTGWVKSSYGNITTQSIQTFSYNNSIIMGNDGNMQIVNQIIHFNESVHTEMSFLHLYSLQSHKMFSLYLFSNYLSKENDASISVANLILGFNEKSSKCDGFRLSNSSLKNLQNGQGSMVVKKNLVVSGLGSTQQVYKYNEADFCYFRNVSSSNYTILYDEEGDECKRKTLSGFGFGFGLSRL